MKVVCSMNMKKVQEVLNRNRIQWTGFLFLFLSLFGNTGFGAERTFNVGTAADLRSALDAFNGTSDSVVINLTGTVNLTGDLPVIKGNGENTLTIKGGGINGAGNYRGLFIDSKKTDGTGSSKITIDGTTFQNCRALGGSGGSGAAGGGGGMGAGGAIYAKSGEIVLKDVVYTNNIAQGGAGGNVLYQSNTYGGGGGLGGNGAGGSVGDALTNNGSGGNGGSVGSGNNGTNSTNNAGIGGGYVYTATADKNQNPHYEGSTALVGGDGGYGGGGGGSIDIGGDGGLGGGGGAGADLGGSGGYGGGGAGGSSASTAGIGGYGAGNGGYQADIPSSNGFSATAGGGTGGGGAGLGGALYIEEGANVSFQYTTDKEMSGNTASGGTAGIVAASGLSGSALPGSGIGSGVFLKDELAINVDAGATYTVNNVLAGDSATRDAGIVKTGDGTLVLNYASSYYGDTTVSGGVLNAAARGAISPYSILNITEGTVNFGADQTVLDLQGGSGAILDLGGKTLNITYGGLEGSIGSYAGLIKSNGETGTGGNLVKSGIGILHLTGDSSDYNFTTTIKGGSIQIGNAGALGNGNIVYAKTDTTDISKALIFDDSMVLENNIQLNGNKDMMRLGTAAGSSDSMRVELAGQITAANSAYGTILLDASNASQIFRFSNTGVSATGVHAAANDNTFTTIDIKKGTLEVVSEKVSGTTEDIYYSGIGSASVNNNGSNSFKLISTGNDDVYLKNDFTFESGLLSFENEQAGQNYHLSGKMSGNGGLALNMEDEDDILYLTGKLTYEGPTRILNGVLDVSGAKTSSYTSGGVLKDYVYLIGLETTSSTSSAKVITGDVDLYLGGIADYSYKGIITDGIPSGTGANIYKTSAGQFDLSLQSGSNVQKITVQNGTLNMVDNSLEAIPITLTNTGVLGIKTDITLNNLDPSVRGTGIKVDESRTLTLGGVANKQNIAANLAGKGSLVLNTRTDGNDWTLSGANSEWNGTLKTTAGSNLILASATGAGGDDAKIQLGSGASIISSINADIPELIMDGSAKLKVATGKELTISKMNAEVPGSQLTIEGLTASDGKILNGGTVVLNNNAASKYYGTTNINRAVLKIFGDNTVASGTRGETFLNGGTIVLDYSELTLAEGIPAFGNIWGTEKIQINGTGGGIDVQGNSKQVVLSNAIQFNGSFDTEGNPVVPQAVFTVREDAVVYDGEFSGDKGDLYKYGIGTMILNGSNTSKITGRTIVNTGTLQLGTSASAPNTQLKDSDLTIYANGTLSGWGNEFKSMVLLGNMDMSSDTIHFTAASGNNAFTMYSGSTIEAAMQNETNYTRFTTDNGDMNLNGGTINVVVDDTYLDQIVSGTSLEMFKTENGTLSAKTSNLILLDNVVGKRLVAEKVGENQLNLVFRNMDYMDYATTGNTRSVAQTINQIADYGGGIYSDVAEQLENAVNRNPNFLQELTGELNISGFNAQISSRNLLRQTVANTLYPTSDAQIFGSRSSIYRGQIQEPDHALSGWGNVFGSLGDAKENEGLAAYDYEMLGGVFGLELGSSDTAQAGVFYSYIHSKLGTDSNIGSLKLDENIFGGYFRWDDALGYGLLLGSANTTNYTGNRSIYISNAENGTFKSDRDGTGFSIYGERGYTFNTGWSRIQPYLGLQYINLQQDGFEETGGGTLSHYRLTMDESEFNSFQSNLGIRANLDGSVNNRPIRAFVYASWIHEFSDTQGEGIASFSAAQGQLPSFRVVGNDLGCNWILGGFGGQYYITNQFQTFGSVDYLASSKSYFVGGNLGVRYLW